MFFFKLMRSCINEKIFCSQGSAIKRNFPALYMLTYKAHLISINKHFRWKLLQVHTIEYLRRVKDNPKANFFNDSLLKQSQHAAKTAKERVKDCYSKVLLKSYSKVRDSTGEYPITMNTPKISQFNTLNKGNTFLSSNVSPIALSALGRQFPLFAQSNTIIDNGLQQGCDELPTPGVSNMASTNRFDFDTVRLSNNKLFSQENTYRVQEEEQMIDGEPTLV